MAMRGLDAKLYIGTPGTLIAYITGIDFSWERDFSEFCAMGTVRATQAFLGVKRYRGGYKRAYVDNTYIDMFVSGTCLIGSLAARTGGTISGTLCFTGGNLANMETEETAAVIESGTFIMYSVTFA